MSFMKSNGRGYLVDTNVLVYVYVRLTVENELEPPA
jgi:hypothetical protein